VFTGIVEELGTIVAVDETAVGSERAVRVTIEGLLVSSDVVVGDSIAVSGVCLTVVDASSGRFTADVMLETLTRSTLHDAGVGTSVNLERAVTLQTRLGGHLVQGHVDGTGVVVRREHTPEWDVVEFSLPGELARYVVQKGSIAVDGVSLTIAAIGAESFSVSLIPTTLQRTTLGAKAMGAGVNLEVDVMAKYAERLLGLATVEGHA